jgi:hypothetical protein
MGDVASSSQRTASGRLSDRFEGGDMFWKLFAIAATILAFGVSSAAAAGPTQQGIRADGLRWQAKADFYGRQLGLKADGLRWQAIARFYAQQKSPAASADGFSWSAAGVGAGSALAAAALGAAALVFVRRSRRTKLAL